MLYVIKYTDPNKQSIVVQESGISGPGQLIDNTGLYIFGYSRLNYGEQLNANLLHLLENFSSAESSLGSELPDPLIIIDPVQGQLWFNQSNQTLYVYNGVNAPTWQPNTIYNIGTLVQPTVGNGHFYRAISNGTSSSISNEPLWTTADGSNITSASGLQWVESGRLWDVVMGASTHAPYDAQRGKMWYDISQYQLKIYDGSNWVSVADKYVLKTGDTMTGQLIINSPDGLIVGTDAAAAQFMVDGFNLVFGADNQTTEGYSGASRIISKGIGTGAGSILFVNKYGDFEKIQLGSILDLGGNRIIDLANPVLDQDAATKKYVDTTVTANSMVAGSGTIGNGAIIPLPTLSGSRVAADYSWYWVVSPATIDTAGTGAIVDIQCYADVNRTVTITYKIGTTVYTDSTANYIIIGIYGAGAGTTYSNVSLNTITNQSASCTETTAAPTCTTQATLTSSIAVQGSGIYSYSWTYGTTLGTYDNSLPADVTIVGQTNGANLTARLNAPAGFNQTQVVYCQLTITDSDTLVTDSKTATISLTSIDQTSGAVQLSATNYSADEGSVIVVTFTRTGGTAYGSAALNYTISNGTAIVGTDYYFPGGIATGQILWTSGDATNKTLTISTIARAGWQGDRSFNITTIAAAGTIAGTPTAAVCSIIETSALAAGNISFDPSIIATSEITGNASNCGTAQAGYALICVSRSGGSDGSVSVQYATQTGTATSGGTNPDYTSTSGTLTWASGASGDKQILVPIANKSQYDIGNRSFYLNLFNPSGTVGAPTITQLQATITIESGYFFSVEFVTPTGVSIYSTGCSFVTATSCEVQNISLTATVNGGGGNYTYQFAVGTYTATQSNGATGQSLISSLGTVSVTTTSLSQITLLTLTGTAPGTPTGYVTYSVPIVATITDNVNPNQIKTITDTITFTVTNQTSPVTASISPSGLSGLSTCTAISGSCIASEIFTVTPAGGTSPYTYDWSIVSSTSPVTTSGQGTTAYTISWSGQVGTSTTGIAQCIVTDSISNTATATQAFTLQALLLG